MKQSNQLSFLPADLNAVSIAARDNPRLFVPLGIGIESGTFKRQRDLTCSDLDMMRRRLTGIKTGLDDCPVEQFLQNALSNHVLVSAYFYPKRFEGLPASIHPSVVPVTMATRAARKAQCFEDVEPLEGRFIYVAALLHSCGLFHCSRNQELFGLPVLTRGSEDLRFARYLLLDAAIQKLRTRNQTMADTMAAVMGLPHGQLYDLEQLARVSAAVCLANLRLTAIWAPEEI